MGTQLVYKAGKLKGKVLWVDTIAIGNPHLVVRLMIDKDGVSPYPDWGAAMVPSGWVDPFYTTWLDLLTTQADAFGFGPVQQLAWDWRLSMQFAANRLMAMIAAVATPDLPCNIVAHSAGGLVARLAYAGMVDNKTTNLVRRVVTLGTPHKGAFDAVKTLSGGVTFYDTWLWNALYGSQGFQLWLPTGIAPDTGTFWAGLAGTWPSIYQLLPMPDEVNAQANTDVLYARISYDTRPYLFQKWFDLARVTVWPLLQDPAHAIPTNILWTLAGTSTPTLSGMKSYDLKQAWDDEFWKASPVADGDGVVTRDSQLVDGAMQWVCACAHRDETSGFAANGMIATALTEDRPTGGGTPIIKNEVIMTTDKTAIFDKVVGSDVQSTIPIWGMPLAGRKLGDP
jgi:hypothetical protein